MRRFVLEDVFDIPSRDGVIFSGTLDGDDIKVGMTLYGAHGRQVRVIGIEFHAKAGKGVLIVDRAGYIPSTPGEILTGHP